MSLSRPFSRYATPPLDEAEKAVLFRALGLGAFSFRYLELAGSTWLRGRETLGPERRTLLTLPRPDDRPTAISRYPGEELPVIVQGPPPALWQRIFPSPFHLLRPSDEPSASRELSPASFAEAVRGLARAFDGLEARLSMTEMSCLYVTGPCGAFPLLLHFVRHRCIRAGTHPSLGRLAAWRGSGADGAQGLRELFKTSATLAFLDAPAPVAGAEALVRLAESIDRLLSDPSLWLGGAPQGEAATSYELGL